MKTLEKLKILKKETIYDKELKNLLKEFNFVDETINNLKSKNVIKKKGYDIITIDKINSQRSYFNNSI